MTKQTFLVSFLFLLLSCSGTKQPTTTQEAIVDSLATKAHTLLLEIQTDSLRTVAEAYIKASPQYSKHFFKAHQYYINSYFNARDYEKVLSLLDQTEQMPHFNDYPEIVCDYMYTRARVFQYSSRHEEAIEVFKRCLTYTPKEVEQQQNALPTILSAMTQLMNTYIASGNVQVGYQYFLQLKEQPTPTIRRLALRDLYSHLGYLAMQAGHVEEGYRITDSVFVLPRYNPTPQKLFSDYSYASIVFYFHPDMTERVIKWLEQAIEEADKYAYTAGVEWSMNTLGSIYWQQNRVEEGIELSYKALNMAKKRGDKKAEGLIYAELSRLYKGWELYEQALEFANQALKATHPTENFEFRSAAYKAKADVFKAMSQPDSSLYYYKKAEEYGRKAQIPNTYNGAKCNMAELLIDYHSGDSLNLGIRYIQEILKETGPNQGKSYFFYCLGKGLIKQGHVHEGEAMLDSMYTEVSRIKNATYGEGVLEFIVDHYLSRGNSSKVMQYAALYHQQAGIHNNEKTSRKVASAMIQYQTEKKEQQLKLANAELSVNDLQIKLYIVALVLLLLVLIGGVLLYWHKRKLHKSRQLLMEQEKLTALREREIVEIRLQEQEQKLTNILENLRDANQQSEQVREQLSDFLADQEKVQKITSITPSIFREKGEVKFRRYFTQLHPNFINALKNCIPDITRGEEILCMLIALHQNMDEVADILCIEKKSVKMSRYRLRKKIGIKQEESLENYINSLI